MLVYRRTDLFESSAQTLVNTVNCVGVMGKGIAHEFKLRNPDMFKAYKRLCDEKQLEPGKLWVWRSTDHMVLNFPTKVHWKNPSKIEWIELGLKKFCSSYEKIGITDASFPRLGCGNGGLDWEDVRPLMERYLGSLKIPIYIHDYTVDVGLPEHMERVAKSLDSSHELSFKEFLKDIRALINRTAGRFEALKSEKPFVATMTDDDSLTVRDDKASWVFENEDLRSAWVTLSRGLLTREKAEWSTGGGGDSFLSMLSVLPNLRPIEIKKPQSSEPEIAVEFEPEVRGTAVVPKAHRPKSQAELSWR